MTRTQCYKAFHSVQHLNSREVHGLLLDGKTIVIIAANEFEDIELEYPPLRLSEEGAKIIVVPIMGGLHPRPVAEKPVSGRFGTPLPLEVMEEGRRYTSRSFGFHSSETSGEVLWRLLYQLIHGLRDFL